MVRHDADHRVVRRVADAGDQHVRLLDGGEGLGGKRSVRVRGGIDRTNVQRDEVRSVARIQTLEDRDAGPVVRNKIVGDQTRRAHRLKHLWSDAPYRRHVLIDVEIDGSRPLDVRRRQPCLRGGRPQRLGPKRARRPIPPSRRARRLGVVIVQDSVLGRADAGDQRRVARIGHGGDDTTNAGGVGPTGYELAQVWCARPRRVTNDVIGPQPVDRNQHDPRLDRASMTDGDQRRAEQRVQSKLR